MSPPKLRWKDLPEYLRKRIKIGPGGETVACWVWTGKVKPGRERYRPYPAIKGDGDGNGYREHAGRFTNEAAVPLVPHPITKTYVDARRHVYGAATMVSVCDVPTLQRCANPLCVSPHHVNPGAPTAAQRKRLEPQPVPKVETAVPVDVMAVLKRERPGVDGHPDWPKLVEEELGLPAGSFTQDLVLEYARYAAENPEDDDDDY